MTRMRPTRSLTCLFAAGLLGPAAAAGQEASLTDPSQYGRWESLGRSAISPGGDWVAYQISRNDGSEELRIWGDSRDSTLAVPWGTNPVFSANGRWLSWTAGHSEEDEEASETPLNDGMGILDLERPDGRMDFDDVARGVFDPTGRWIALLAHRPTEGDGGATLRVVDLETGAQTSFGSVGEIAWSDTRSLLAMTIESGSDEGNGLQVYDAQGGRLHPLDHSGARYTGASWREESASLAVLRSADPASGDSDGYQVLAWLDVTLGQPPQTLPAMPGGTGDSLQVVSVRSPEWSPSGDMLSLGLRPVPSDEKDEGDGGNEESEPQGAEDKEAGEGDEGDEDGPPELADVQIWHANDVEVYAQQRAGEARRANRALTAVWHLEEDRVVVVSSRLDTSVEILPGWERALEEDDEPYPWGAKFGRPYHDVWAIDLRDGAREQVAERVRYAWASGAGHWLLTFDGDDYHSQNLESGARYNLTEGVPAAFADTAYDTPTDVFPPFSFGPGGWLEEDQGVFLYDEHDIWRFALDGSSAERMTDGAEGRLTHRILSLPDSDDEPGMEVAGPWHTSLYHEWTEQRGFGRLHRSGRVEELLLEDAFLSGLTRADSADAYVFRRMSHDDPPDLFVAGSDLANPTQVTRINPFMGEYAWGRAELVEFESESGRSLQGVLKYPVGYEPGTRVPMIVYTYEMLSPQFHVFENPNERDYYNFTRWTQEGYAVLLPDIVYRWREPGPSALESVRAAVATVVEMGVADPERVGLIGHSWGGYQATYLPTRTDIFAASVAGAPLTDFVSFMGALHWNPGLPELSHWETGQARMEVPFWEDPEAHRRSSPIHGVQDLETPLLMAFGNEDGVVDWDQGTEFYNFARRAGKQMVLLVYEGEDHGLRGEANQVDYHRRILEWFGHYLKDEPAPAWITDGITIEDLEGERRRVAEKRAGGHLN